MLLYASWICILPLKAIKLGESAEAELSSIYQVVWSDRKLYEAEILALGMLLCTLLFS